jgi:hypothetical protein
VDAVQFLAVLAVLAFAVVVISAPLRRGPEAEVEAEDRDRPALEAAKEAKYREIRDAELDRRTGKLSDEDWRELDAQLRAEAVAILKRLDDASASDAPSEQG